MSVPGQPHDPSLRYNPFSLGKEVICITLKIFLLATQNYLIPMVPMKIFSSRGEARGKN